MDANSCRKTRTSRRGGGFDGSRGVVCPATVREEGRYDDIDDNDDDLHWTRQTASRSLANAKVGSPSVWIRVSKCLDSTAGGGAKETAEGEDGIWIYSSSQAGSIR